MMIEQDILRRTNDGLSIYRLILREIYPGEETIHFTGNEIDLVKNPFNKHRKTMKIVKEGAAFHFSDIEQPELKGSPFKFASMYYKIEGMPLYQLLNHVMKMNIDVRYFKVHAVFSPSPKHKETTLPFEASKAETMFSFFRAPIRNVNPFKDITLLEAYEMIRSDAYAKTTLQLRSFKNPAEARTFKTSQFNYATFSGIFSSRSASSLTKHSGLVTIDFDHLPDVHQLKKQLIADPRISTELLFVSPSGDGLKWIIRKNRTEMTHSDFFMAVSNYIRKTYQVEIDPSGKDVSRACFLPCDPDAFIHPKYLTA